MPTALKRPNGKSGCCPDSPAPTPTCRSSGFRRCHSMSRTWMPCVRSPIRLLRSATMRAAQRPDEEPANQLKSATMRAAQRPDEEPANQLKSATMRAAQRPDEEPANQLKSATMRAAQRPDEEPANQLKSATMRAARRPDEESWPIRHCKVWPVTTT